MASLRQLINDLYSKGDWQEALRLQNATEDEYSTVLWIRPSVEDLEFIERAVSSRGLGNLISIGCGSGFLEWILQSATVEQCLGLPVTGVEVDRNWWTSPYIMVYIQHVYQEDNKCIEILEDSNSAIMFCYFNNERAFNDYLNKFKGNCLIIIGPKRNRHTNPHPFHPTFMYDEWTLVEYRQVQDSDDYIVIYERKCKNNRLKCL